MNTFRCGNCGLQLQRPSQPYACPQCGRQAVGLFRLVSVGGPSAPGGVPPSYPPQQPYTPPQQGYPPPQQPYVPPQQPYTPPQQGYPPPQQPYIPPQQPYTPPQPPYGPPMQPGAPQYAPPSPQYRPPTQPYAPPGPQYQPPQPYTPPGPQYPQPPQPYVPPGQQYPPPNQQQYPPPQQYPAAPQPYAPPGQQYPPPGQQYPTPQQPYTPPAQPAPPQPQQYTPPVQGGVPPAQPYAQPPQQGVPPGAVRLGARQRMGPAPTPQPAAPVQPTPAPVYPTEPGAAPPVTAGPAAPIPVAPTAEAPAPAVPPSAPPVAAPPPAAPVQATPPTAPRRQARAQPPAPPGQAPTAQPPATPSKPAASPRRSATPAPTAPSGGAPTATPPTKPSQTARPKPAPSQPAAEKAAPPEPVSEPPKKVRPKPIRPERFAWALPEEPPDENRVAPVRNAPAIDAGGRMFLHLGDRLVGLEEENGRAKICWEYVTGCRAPGPVVVAPDGSLRLHSSDGSLHCLSSAGKQLWMPATVGEPLGHAAPMVDDQGNTWVCAYSGGLVKVDANGRMHKPGPFFRARQKLDAGGVIRQGVLYVGSEDGCLFAIRLDGEKGVNLWNHMAGQGQTDWYIHCTPALSDDGVLIVAGRDENLYGFRLDGEPVFKTPMPGQMLGSPVLDRFGHMYVGVSQAQRGQQARGLLVCLDGNSHKIRWEYKAAGPVESTPVIGSDDTIYFGDNAGVIHAVDFRATPQWTAQVEAPVRSAGAIIGPERVAFGLDNETLVVLKCSSRSLAEGGWPKLGRTLGQCGLA